MIHRVENKSSFKFNEPEEEGWTLIEDCGFVPAITSIENLELVDYLKNGEKEIFGERMAIRAVELNANLGQKHAEFLLEHQEEIPKEFEKYLLVFPGTKWYFPDQTRVILCLIHDVEWATKKLKWCFRINWLDHSAGPWRGGCRLLRFLG